MPKFAIYTLGGGTSFAPSIRENEGKNNANIKSIVEIKTKKTIFRRDHYLTGHIISGIRYMGKIPFFTTSDTKVEITRCNETFDECFARVSKMTKDRKEETTVFRYE